TVALSGGVFQNVLLAERTVRGLEEIGFRVLTHTRVPCNDGGISFGQAVGAAARDRRPRALPPRRRGGPSLLRDRATSATSRRSGAGSPNGDSPACMSSRSRRASCPPSPNVSAAGA